jgi:hypothetical protein
LASLRADMTLGGWGVVWTDLAVRVVVFFLILELDAVERSQYSGRPVALFKGGPEENTDRETSGWFRPRGEDWLDKPCPLWWRGVYCRGAEVRPDGAVRKSGGFLEELCFPDSCGDRTVGSAVEERTLDLASVRYCEEICGFSRGALFPWFVRGSNGILSVGPGVCELHPARYVRRRRASGNLEFNLPLTSKPQFIEQYFRV